jgi:soluble epoxide hydrolase / lipid-phosphate phosphatase
VVLVHGYPDLSLAWRYQIPMLLSLGLRTLAIDCMGYGSTGTSSNLKDFTFKTHADAIAAIAKQIGAPKIILGGHDWGGIVVYRAAQWYPDLISHVFSVATPYLGPTEKFVSVEELVKGPLPNFGYQLQLGSEDQQIESRVKDEKSIRKFLTAVYGGKPKSGKTFLTPENGVDVEVLEKDEIGMTPLLNQEVCFTAAQIC